MVLVILEGIDAVGKTTETKKLGYPSIKFPFDQQIKDQIMYYYAVLNDREERLHPYIIKTIYEQIHDLYDLDFRRYRKQMQLANMDNDVLILDRYFISNVVYSRLHGLSKPAYEEDHLVPDLTILLKVKDYSSYKKKFFGRRDEIVKDPKKLYYEHQPLYLKVVKELKQKKLMKDYVIVDALRDDTTQRIREAISNFSN